MRSSNRSAMGVGRRSVVVLVAALVLAAGACGSRRGLDEIAAAAGGAAVDGFGSATGTASGAPGSATATTAAVDASGAPVVAGSTGDAGGVAAPTGDAGEQPADAGGAPAAAGPSCPDGPLSPVTIGHIGGYEGLVGATLAGGLETAQVWARSVNSRGGLSCHPVNLVAVNDRNDPNTNAALVRQLVEERGVIAFVGNLTPLSLGGGLAYLEQRQIPLVGGDLVHPSWLTSPMAYPQGVGTDIGAPASMREGVRVAQERGLPNPTRAAMFVCEVEACAAGHQAVQAQNGNGYELVYAPSISLVQTNFTNQCREAQRQNVGVIFVGGGGATLEAAANSCADQGYRPQWVTYSLAIQDSLAGNPNLEATIGASPTFPWMLRDGAAAEYGDALARFAPGLTTSGAASQVWTAGKLLEAAGAQLPAEPTAADVLAGLAAVAGNDLGGLTTALDFSGGAGRQSGCYFAVQVSGGTWTAPRGAECTPS